MLSQSTCHIDGRNAKFSLRTEKNLNANKKKENHNLDSQSLKTRRIQKIA